MTFDIVWMAFVHGLLLIFLNRLQQIEVSGDGVLDYLISNSKNLVFAVDFVLFDFHFIIRYEQKNH